MTTVENYYDFSDLVKEVNERTEVNIHEVEHVLKNAFKVLAERIGKAEHPVIFDNVGTFIVSPQQAKDWKFLKRDENGNIFEQVGTTPPRLKVRFKSAKAFAQMVKDNLPKDLSHFDVK